jgi:hypothetical protein
VKALVSVFFLFSSPLPDFVGGTLAPKPLLPRRFTYGRLPLLSCLAQSLPLAPTVNLTYATANFAVVDGGTPSARYSGSAAGAGGQRDWWARALGWLPLTGRRASRVATHPPP